MTFLNKSCGEWIKVYKTCVGSYKLWGGWWWWNGKKWFWLIMKIKMIIIIISNSESVDEANNMWFENNMQALYYEDANKLWSKWLKKGENNFFDWSSNGTKDTKSTKAVPQTFNKAWNHSDSESWRNGTRPFQRSSMTWRNSR